MTARTVYASTTCLDDESEHVNERLEWLKMMACILEAQLVDVEPSLAELASNMSDEIDAVVAQIGQ